MVPTFRKLCLSRFHSEREVLVKQISDGHQHQFYFTIRNINHS